MLQFGLRVSKNRNEEMKINRYGILQSQNVFFSDIAVRSYRKFLRRWCAQTIKGYNISRIQYLT